MKLQCVEYDPGSHEVFIKLTDEIGNDRLEIILFDSEMELLYAQYCNVRKASEEKDEEVKL